MGQIIGLKAVHAGNPLPKGVKDAEAADLMKAFTKSVSLIMVVFPPISRYLPVMIFIGKEKQTHFTLQSTKRQAQKKLLGMS